MKISETGLNLIKRFEGFRAEAYKCAAGVWTIGYGHTNGVKKGMIIDELKAETFLMIDVQKCEYAINTLVKTELNQNQFDALVSFIYNVGTEKFTKSTMLKFLNAGHFPLAAGQFDRWNKVKGVVCQGLVNRRKAEKELFLKK